MSRTFLFSVLPLILIGIVISIITHSAILFVFVFSVGLSLWVYYALCNMATILEKNLLKATEDVSKELLVNSKRIDGIVADINNRFSSMTTKNADATAAINAIIENLRTMGKAMMTLRQQVDANRVTLIRHEKKFRGKNNISLNDRY